MIDSKNCIFCEISIGDRIIDQNETCFVIKDAFPVTEGHLLIIPKKHVADYFDLNENEKSDIQFLMEKHRNLLQKSDGSIKGFNIGINVGQAAGQTIFHTHVHLIPRRHGDVEDPKGGVRGVISNKQKY